RAVAQLLALQQRAALGAPRDGRRALEHAPRAAPKAVAAHRPAAERAELLALLSQELPARPGLSLAGDQTARPPPFDDPARDVAVAPVTAGVDAFEAGVNAARA